MARDQIRARQSFFLPAPQAAQAVAGLAAACWQPPVDVYQTEEGWLVKFDLAGVRRDEIQLQASGQRLTLQGKRRDSSVGQGCRSYRLEINYSQFERSVELPHDLEQADIATEYRDGMLLVRIASEKAS
jgi:HSP20 family protein